MKNRYYSLRLLYRNGTYGYQIGFPGEIFPETPKGSSEIAVYSIPSSAVPEAEKSIKELQGHPDKAKPKLDKLIKRLTKKFGLED